MHLDVHEHILLVCREASALPLYKSKLVQMHSTHCGSMYCAMWDATTHFFLLQVTTPGMLSYGPFHDWVIMHRCPLKRFCAPAILSGGGLLCNEPDDAHDAVMGARWECRSSAQQGQDTPLPRR